MRSIARAPPPPPVRCADIRIAWRSGFRVRCADLQPIRGPKCARKPGCHATRIRAQPGSAALRRGDRPTPGEASAPPPVRCADIRIAWRSGFRVRCADLQPIRGSRSARKPGCHATRIRAQPGSAALRRGDRPTPGKRRLRRRSAARTSGSRGDPAFASAAQTSNQSVVPSVLESRVATQPGSGRSPAPRRSAAETDRSPGEASAPPPVRCADIRIAWRSGFRVRCADLQPIRGAECARKPGCHATRIRAQPGSAAPRRGDRSTPQASGGSAAGPLRGHPDRVAIRRSRPLRGPPTSPWSRVCSKAGLPRNPDPGTARLRGAPPRRQTNPQASASSAVGPLRGHPDRVAIRLSRPLRRPPTNSWSQVCSKAGSPRNPDPGAARLRGASPRRSTHPRGSADSAAGPLRGHPDRVAIRLSRPLRGPPTNLWSQVCSKAGLPRNPDPGAARLRGAPPRRQTHPRQAPTPPPVRCADIRIAWRSGFRVRSADLLWITPATRCGRRRRGR